MPISAATNPAYNPPGTTKRNQLRYTWVFGYRFTDTEYETFSNFTSLPNLYTAWCMWIDWQVGIRKLLAEEIADPNRSSRRAGPG